MQSPCKLGSAFRAAVVAAALGAVLALAGCGMPGAPQPPSLNLPDRVGNLSAVRTGNQVALAWSMPVRTTDKVALKPPVTVRICRNEASTARCNIATTLQLAPGADGSLTDTLPPTLAAGPPRVLTYFVELVNRKGRSAGLSNGAEVLAGAAPPAVEALSAELRKDGVVLHWAPAPAGSEPAAIRLQRKLLSPPVKNLDQGPLAPPAEAPLRTLLVAAGTPSQRALDADIRFGQTYEYRAQRVARVVVNGQAIELAGPLSAPLRIEAADIFPPAVPHGLAAVATAGENGNPPAIDLSWLPGADSDLVGYIVYRQQVSAAGATETAWQRISPAQPVIGPGYHDTNVLPGHTYAYSVTAIGQNGHESARSATTQETVPLP